MDQIKKKKKDSLRNSLKWSFLIYMPFCVFVALIGSYIIGAATNWIQEWYRESHADMVFHLPEGEEFDLDEAEEVWEEREGMSIEEWISENLTQYAGNGEPDEQLSSQADMEEWKERLKIMIDEEGNHYLYVMENPFAKPAPFKNRIIYWIISYGQVILILLWVIFCIALTGLLFYKREMEQAINSLFDASKKISENCLDFHLIPAKSNELGQLCSAFENMRAALYRNNLEVWRMAEERKQLNAAFSHDMRTPITVLKGYSDFLEKYLPSGKISPEKIMEIVSMMGGQIERLEIYTRKMSAVQKMEDIIPEYRKVVWKQFLENCQGSTEILTESLKAEYEYSSTYEEIMLDAGLVMEVYENLLANAARYAKEYIQVTITAREEKLNICVKDDGDGFTEEALKRASDPFYRENKAEDMIHFGLGLYICKIICEKCEGELKIENGETGAMVTAVFQINPNF